MLYREIIAVCSQIHTKHINTLCEQNVEFVNILPDGTVHTVTTGLWRVESLAGNSWLNGRSPFSAHIMPC